ncbi:MAG: DinB family protein [Chitinophagaceae bacterium]|nr:DinB family protein [Chitinophagaceae bacterium]
MHSIAQTLDTVIDEYWPLLQKIPGDKLLYKPSALKWSKKEIIGHLVDSAQNNIRRFIVAQYEDSPHIVYKQDNWVAVSGYQQYDMQELLNLWRSLNKHMVIVLKNIPPGIASRTCLTESLHSIEWLAEDYIRHLKHHLHQVLDLEPVAYP